MVRQALIPFVKYLTKSKQTKNDRFSVPDPYKIAEAEAACALGKSLISPIIVETMVGY